MTNNDTYYREQLYPLQDQALQIINNVDTNFYLTGGTALSRAYLHHRYSDDLDLFVNYDPTFTFWSSLIIDALQVQPTWQLQIAIRQQHFVRLFLMQDNIPLKIELINDVPSRVGEVAYHADLGRIDSVENILANKLSALIGRDEPRDIADIWGICTQLGLPLKSAINGAQSKAEGIYPPELARKLCTATPKEWELVRWIQAPDVDEYLDDLRQLGDALLIVE